MLARGLDDPACGCVDDGRDPARLSVERIGSLHPSTSRPENERSLSVKRKFCATISPMKAVLQLFWQICRLKQSPEYVPTQTWFVLLVIAANLICSAAVSLSAEGAPGLLTTINSIVVGQTAGPRRASRGMSSPSSCRSPCSHRPWRLCCSCSSSPGA